MVASFTPNLQLTLPARGDDVGTWDTPVNGNETLIDLVAGGIATIPLNNSNVVLSAAQFQSRNITFNSTLTGSVTITFPTSFTKSYEIQHLCTGSSAFTITLETTATGGQVICAPPGETIDVFNDGTNLKYKNMGHIGEYWDYAGAAAPNWVAGCTIPPYVNCDGSAISSIYTVLPVVLGSSLLPDLRGRARFALDQGVGRVSSAQSGIAGNTLFGSGGLQAVTLGTSNLPPYTPVGNIATTITGGSGNQGLQSGTGGPVNIGGGGSGGSNIPLLANSVFAGGAQGGVSAPTQNMPPVLISGVMLIRAG